MRRCAILPRGDALGTAGASPGHHTTTGASGSSRLVTSPSSSDAPSPYARSTMPSLAPASPPTRICPSMRAASSLRSTRRESTMTRIGCSREASLAASMASSSLPRVVAITRVSTRPRATAPPSSRILTRAFETALVVVSGRSTIMILSGYAVSGFDCPRAVTSGTTPAAAVAGEQLVGGCGAPGTGLVLLQRPSEGLPELFDGVEDLPAQFDFLVSREERRVTEQHVEDEPLVGLRTRLGEGVAVAEVHRHVAHLHAGSRHLG